LLYGHVDKQPEMEGWDPELGPWKPVLRGDRLYGRGGADDGYAAFASVLALRILEEQRVPHAPCGILIEACEESGSYDLPAYIDHLAPRIGTPSLVVCLDSGCGNYDQLWCTTSLRGLAGGTLHVEVLGEGVHSGDASGVVPSSFRVARALLARIEDAADGRMLLPELHAEIPPGRLREAARAAKVLGAGLHRRFPWQGEAGPVSRDETELVLNRTWRPFLEVTGAAGVPDLERAGNVLRPRTALKLSIRLPPTCDASRARDALQACLEADPPHGAEVRFRSEAAVSGWNAPPSEPWLVEALDATSQSWFNGRPAVHMGEGGTIPFMGMLGEKFPEAQFVITGVLGPGSNAHGPNEFLHIPTAKRLSGCVAQLLEQHALRP
jgi:acetylornithine deacetylase/succinyl-diaminopimelate desuccinylase-like protein